jgi:hypothetical protein
MKTNLHPHLYENDAKDEEYRLSILCVVALLLLGVGMFVSFAWGPFGRSEPNESHLNPATTPTASPSVTTGKPRHPTTVTGPLVYLGGELREEQFFRQRSPFPMKEEYQGPDAGTPATDIQSTPVEPALLADNSSG